MQHRRARSGAQRGQRLTPQRTGAWGKVPYSLQIYEQTIDISQGLQVILFTNLTHAHSMNTLEQLCTGQLAGTRKLILRCGLTKFPREIFDLADSLEVLDLSGNALTSLPDDLPRLTRLRVLFCSNNPFTELPEVLGQCPAFTRARHHAWRPVCAQHFDKPRRPQPAGRLWRGFVFLVGRYVAGPGPASHRGARRGLPAGGVAGAV